MVRALRDGILVRALPRRSDPDAVDRALPPPGRLPGRDAQRRQRRADPGAVRVRDRAERRGVPPAPRAGAAARGSRSEGGLDRAAAGGRALRQPPSRPARHPCRHRPAGPHPHRSCRGRGHGRWRRARLHPYRRGQGAARVRRADRPRGRHQHGGDRSGRRRLALERPGTRRAFPPRLRRQQSAQ